MHPLTLSYCHAVDSGHLPFLHPEHLVLELLSQLRMDALVNPHGVENQTNGQ